MIDVTNKNCVACGACEAVCPQKCISINISKNEEYRPNIDEDKCIGCNLCERVCLLNNHEISSYPIGDSYFGWAKEKCDRKNSSSGGIANAIAKRVILSNGVVIGACFNLDWTVSHRIVESIQELEQIQGSKYVESRCGSIFPEIKKILQDGREVLFTGVPCQIFALKSYLQKEYENLICLEVFCHGAPRIGVFKKYIEYIEKRYGTIKKFNFRSKYYGWANASYCIACQKKELHQKHIDNVYHLMFGYHNSIRQSCFNCVCRQGERYADISLGDFWGIEKFYSQTDVKNGVSAIFINSKKGKGIFTEIQNDVCIHLCNKEEILEKNTWFVKNYGVPINQEEYEYDVQNLSPHLLFRKYYFLYKYWFRIKRFVNRGKNEDTINKKYS